MGKNGTAWEGRNPPPPELRHRSGAAHLRGSTRRADCKSGDGDGLEMPPLSLAG
jgi:hypothetical protein